jgi:hypothetical protein
VSFALAGVTVDEFLASLSKPGDIGEVKKRQPHCRRQKQQHDCSDGLVGFSVMSSLPDFLHNYHTSF